MLEKVAASDPRVIDCAIIGGGPAGLIAALYLKRFRRKTVVFDRGNPRLLKAPLIRNLAGFHRGISGRSLLAKMQKQVTLEASEFVKGEAQVKRLSRKFLIQVGSTKIHARTVILATGVRDFEPNVPNHEELCRDGLIAYCPVCDGFNHRDHKIAVLVRNGEGISKIKALSVYSNELHVATVKDFNISPIHLALMKKLGARLHRGDLESLTRQGKKLVVKMRLRVPFQVDVAYAELGTYVNRRALQKLRKLRRTTKGYIITSRHQETSIPRLYAIGDCTHGLAQVSVAIGQAAIAATHISKRLREMQEK